MKENDTLHDAYKASDERLYVNKQKKTAVHDNLLWLFACNLRSMK